MHRRTTWLNASWIWSCLLLVACGGSSGTFGSIDSSLVGTWQGEGSLMTSSMAKQGRYLLRIERDGSFVLAVRSDNDFALDTGRFDSASGGGFVRHLASGLEERGTYRIANGTLSVQSIFASWSAHPAGKDENATLDAVVAVSRVPAQPRISDRVTRAAAIARLWQPDAGLEYVSLTGLGEDGLLLPDTQATIGFYSRRTRQFLTLSPLRSGAGFSMFVAARTNQELGPRAIPVPIRDVQWLIQGERNRGFKGRYGAIQLRFFGDSPRQARALWLAQVGNSDHFVRHCWDLAADQITDCRPLAGDPDKDYAELEAKAAAAMAAMMQSASGGGSNTSFEIPQDDLTRCYGAGGNPAGNACIRGEERIFP
ncbi:MAG: hypothetical protein QM696_07480 [Steroidobacteraceae bacterium]